MRLEDPFYSTFPGDKCFRINKLQEWCFARGKLLMRKDELISSRPVPSKTDSRKLLGPLGLEVHGTLVLV